MSMSDINTLQFIETVFSILQEKGKSDDLADLLIELDLPAPSELNDIVTELALAANPVEEAGVGCLRLEEIREMIDRYKAAHN